MTHDQVREMVRRVNPIPDPNALETVVTSVPVTRQERRADMQTDDRVVTENGRPSRGRGALIGIAAAAAVLVGGVLYYLSNNNNEVAEPAPNATPVSKDFQPLDPGAYYVDTDSDESTTLRSTFVIEGSGWTGLGAGAMKQPVDDGPYIALLVAEVDQVWEPACGVGTTTPQAAGTSAEDLGNQFVATGLTITGALAPVSAFGHEGYHLATEVPADCHSNGDRNVWASPNWGGRYYQDEGQLVEYWFLDVEDTPVFVEASWFPESSEEDVAELRAVLDTLVITP